MKMLQIILALLISIVSLGQARTLEETVTGWESSTSPSRSKEIPEPNLPIRRRKRATRISHSSSTRPATSTASTRSPSFPATY